MNARTITDMTLIKGRWCAWCTVRKAFQLPGLGLLIDADVMLIVQPWCLIFFVIKIFYLNRADRHRYPFVTHVQCLKIDQRCSFFFLKNLVTELLQSTLKIHPAAYDLAKNFSIVAWIHSLCHKR